MSHVIVSFDWWCDIISVILLLSMASEHISENISFEPQQILRSNGHTLEAANFSPFSLQDFVDTHEEVIAKKIESIHINRTRKVANPDSVKKETILIARLAMFGDEHLVLSLNAYDNPQRFYDSPLDLNENFRPYWAHLAETAFTPRVRNRNSPNAGDTTGMWLGVTLP